MYRKLLSISQVFCFSLFLSNQVFCQIELDFSFIQYQEEYQPLTSGDTIWGMNNEKFGLDVTAIDNFERIIPLPEPLIINQLEEWVFDYLIFAVSGGNGIASFNEDLNQENILVLSPATTFNYMSPLNDPENTDQGYIIYSLDEDYLRIDFQNLAHSEELHLGDGRLISRFNFQVEYRIADSRTRYIYGPSIISTELRQHLGSIYIFSFFAVELSQYDEFGEWDNYYDGEMLLLIGLPDEPMQTRISDVNFWDPQISLIDFPSESTVYEFNILPPSSNNELVLLEDKIKFYPNPTTDFLMVDPIKEDLFDRDDVYFKIFSIDGKLLLNHHLNQTSQIDLRSLNSGSYLLKITSDKFNAYGRIIKK